MSNASLTAKYRPQTFADVAGQETLKAILSRAALEDKVAPAYLFSGTRGVGKTTLARVFAKALNCRQAPAAEPCNQCDLCRAVTQGNAVDVVEIDGASNRGIDDVRRLKEVVGYAPMDGRYKIFIIDEAHMLSREAFNALLKTLEEPPARVTFIMATTEPHKFPATIISRCQHYVFKRLPETELITHLSGVLSREGVDFDENAVRLIARRGAGSVRDSMSLLSQVLALETGALTEDSARTVLGLAGQEAFMSLLHAFRDGDTLSLIATLRDMLDQGLDLGFFLRELSALWRNMFILRQSGKAAIPVTDLPEAEAAGLLEIAQEFSLSHIHACWQMTLEGQRRVLTSLEPALSLELLLLNLAMLPKLLSLETLTALGRRSGTAPSGSGPSGSGPASQAPPGTPPRSIPGGQTPPPSGRQALPEQKTTPAGRSPIHEHEAKPEASTEARVAEPAKSVHESSFSKSPDLASERREGLQTEHQSQEKTESNVSVASEDDPQCEHYEPSPLPDKDSGVTAAPAAIQQDPAGSPSSLSSTIQERPAAETASILSPEDKEPPVEETTPANSAPPVQETVPEARHEVTQASPLRGSPFPAWEEVLNACRAQDAPPWFSPLAQRASSEWSDEKLLITPQDAFTSQRLQEPGAREVLDTALKALCGNLPAIEFLPPVSIKKDRDELKKEVYEHPLVQEMQKSFGARIVDYGQMR